MSDDRINDFIDEHEQEIIASLQELIAIPSCRTEGKEGMPFGSGVYRVLNTALAKASKLGFQSINLDQYVGYVDMQDGEPELGVLCHLDVVPEGTGWVHPPYGGVVENGKMYGRGTTDNKGAAISSLYAMYALKSLKIPLKSNVRLILGCDEESGCADIHYYKERNKMPPQVFSPDAEYPLVNIEKGHLSFQFKAEYPASKGKAQIISINGGVASNVVPSQAHAVVKGFTLDEVNKAIQQARPQITATFYAEQKDECIEIRAVGKGAHASVPQEGDNAISALLAMLLYLPLDACDGIDMLKKAMNLLPYSDTRGENLGIACSDEKSGALTLAFDIFNYSPEQFSGECDIRFPICETSDRLVNKISASLQKHGLHGYDYHKDEPHYVDEGTPFVQTLLKVYEQQTGKKGVCVAMGGGTYVHNIEGGVAFGPVFPGVDNKVHGSDEFVSIDDLILNTKVFAHAIAEICG